MSDTQMVERRDVGSTVLQVMPLQQFDCMDYRSAIKDGDLNEETKRNEDTTYFENNDGNEAENHDQEDGNVDKEGNELVHECTRLDHNENNSVDRAKRCTAIDIKTDHEDKNKFCGKDEGSVQDLDQNDTRTTFSIVNETVKKTCNSVRENSSMSPSCSAGQTKRQLGRSISQLSNKVYPTTTNGRSSVTNQATKTKSFYGRLSVQKGHIDEREIPDDSISDDKNETNTNKSDADDSFLSSKPLSSTNYRRKEASKKLYQRPLYETVEYLTMPYEEDLDKMRAIYSWLVIISAQLDKLKFPMKNTVKGSTFCYLKKLKNRMMNHAEVMCHLCSLISIPCVVVHGFQKGANFKIEESVAQLDNFGVWNAVLLENQWYLLNVFWASERSSFGSKVKDMYVDSFFFLTPPDKLLFTHYPAKDRWQIVEEPISLEEFESRAFLKERFFEMEMEVLSHPYNQILVEHGEKEIKFRVNSASASFLKFICTIYRYESGEFNGVSPPQNTSNYMIRLKNGNVLVIKLRFPTKGFYRLEIIGKDSQIDSHGYEYDYTAVYGVHVANVPAIGIQYFPVCGDFGWGRDSQFFNYGDMQLCMDPYIVTSESPFKLDLSFLENVKLDGPITYKLCDLDTPLEQAELKTAMEDEDNLLYLTADLAAYQETAVCIFTEMLEKKRKIFRNIGNFLIFYQKPESPSPEPSIMSETTSLKEATPACSPTPIPSPIPVIAAALLATEDDAIQMTDLPNPDIVKSELRSINVEDEAGKSTPMHWTRKFLITSKAKQKFLHLRKSSFKMWD
ncbi:hypothetical protein FSP39_007450 [Pinctada imbricata]|uniref:KY-like immunoglobulin-like domain-containing protein n=1 Tax=Pinctada imbricata TaxID=66713 RepID=A0AA88XVT2_PINIB|nr:hypothetical protein FSP39_007450 [Pinctada imbricata]